MRPRNRHFRLLICAAALTIIGAPAAAHSFAIPGSVGDLWEQFPLDPQAEPAPSQNPDVSPPEDANGAGDTGSGWSLVEQAIAAGGAAFLVTGGVLLVVRLRRRPTGRTSTETVALSAPAGRELIPPKVPLTATAVSRVESSAQLRSRSGRRQQVPAAAVSPPGSGRPGARPAAPSVASKGGTYEQPSWASPVQLPYRAGRRVAPAAETASPTLAPLPRTQPAEPPTTQPETSRAPRPGLPIQLPPRSGRNGSAPPEPRVTEAPSARATEQATSPPETPPKAPALGLPMPLPSRSRDNGSPPAEPRLTPVPEASPTPQATVSSVAPTEASAEPPRTSSPAQLPFPPKPSKRQGRDPNLAGEGRHRQDLRFAMAAIASGVVAALIVIAVTGSQ